MFFGCVLDEIFFDGLERTCPRTEVDVGLDESCGGALAGQHQQAGVRHARGRRRGRHEDELARGHRGGRGVREGSRWRREEHRQREGRG